MEWVVAIAPLLLVVLLPAGLLHALGALKRRISPLATARLPRISAQEAWRAQLTGVVLLLAVLTVRAVLGHEPDSLMLFWGPFFYISTVGAIIYWRYPDLWPWVSASREASPLARRVVLGFAYLFAVMATVAALALAVILATAQA